MIAMVVDRAYRCVVLSDIPPVYKDAGRSADDYRGQDTLEHISEGEQEWREAIDYCLSTQEDTTCEFYNKYQSYFYDVFTVSLLHYNLLQHGYDSSFHFYLFFSSFRIR